METSQHNLSTPNSGGWGITVTGGKNENIENAHKFCYVPKNLTWDIFPLLSAGMSTCDVYFLNFCLIFKTKKIKLGSLVKFLLSNKSVQSLQRPPACPRKWTWVGGHTERENGSWWGLMGSRAGSRNVANLLKEEKRWNKGRGYSGLVMTSLLTLIVALISTALDSSVFLAMGPKQEIFRELFWLSQPEIWYAFRER